MKWMNGHSSNRIQTAAEWCLRLALGSSLLSAVADRFGFWGLSGAPNVTWGDWTHFVQYCARVNSFLPVSWAGTLAWISTILEVLFGICLIAGVYLRVTSYGAAGLLLLFAIAMTISFGLHPPFSYSVFVDAAAALLLGALHEEDKKEKRTYT